MGGMQRSEGEKKKIKKEQEELGEGNIFPRSRHVKT